MLWSFLNGMCIVVVATADDNNDDADDVADDDGGCVFRTLTNILYRYWCYVYGRF